MLRALFEADVRPDLILGTSVGALNGALVAADPSDAVIGRLLGLWESAATTREVYGDGPVRQVTRAVRTGTHLHSAKPLRDRLVQELGDAHLRRARGAVPVLRGPHRGRRRALVHRGPGHRRGDGVAPPCPACCGPAEVDGEHYLDGGIVNSIPVGRAVECGATAVFVLQVGRVDRPLRAAAQAVGGRPGLLRDRPPAPVPPRDGRAARRTSTAHVLPTGGGTGARHDSLLRLPRLRGVSRRIDDGVRRHRGLPRGAPRGDGAGSGGSCSPRP